MEHRFRLRLLDRIADVAPAAWDALHDGHPALTHAFLDALEQTGCVGRGTGWTARHATLWEGDALVAAAPMYEKAHSWGEYVFDWAWAEAHLRCGLRYYPKWLVAVPFCPLPGMRLLGRSPALRQRLATCLVEAAAASGRSSLHLLFVEAEEAGWLESSGLLVRRGIQFHWHNDAYPDFEAFLASLNHDKRKKIRQERRKAGSGLDFQWLSGHEASAADWQFFYRCYAQTYAEHGGAPYLTPVFFTRVAAVLPQAVRLLVVRRGPRPIASALFLVGGNALYGRYWGAVEYVPCLHFETCYYQAIEYAIGQGIARFEGGAQGEHKLARGLVPVPTVSAHWLRDPRLARAVADYLAREGSGVEDWIDELNERAPFRRA